MFVLLLLVCGFSVGEILGHGMVLNPPNRSSLWRFDPSAPINYDDNQNWCGGFWMQWGINGGKCGVCGDNYLTSIPRANENTGKYGQGVIVAKYSSGAVIEVDVLLTANHKGYFNYSLCVLEDSLQPETDDCFISLRFQGGSDKFPIHPDARSIKNYVQLPAGLTCNHCVLKWNYHTGNSWGYCEDGTSAVGCGPQETFRSCSDIAIV